MNTFLSHTPEENPGLVLWHVTHMWQRILNTILKKYDLTHLQFVLLATIAWLDHKHETITQIKLAKQTKIHTMQVSQVLKALEQKKYITRKPAEKDPRANVINITREGYQKVKFASAVVEKAERDFFDLNKTDERVFIKTLAHLANKGIIFLHSSALF